MIAKISNYRRGLLAETIAALYLWAKGYRIRARRYKTSVGEIDLIVTRGKTIVFVEVKVRARIDDSLGAIRPASHGRLQRAATQYIASHPRYAGYNMRFDLLALSPPYHIRHLDNIDLTGS